MRQLVAYFLRLGSFGFGGPAALVAIMEDDLVERRHWPCWVVATAGIFLPSFLLVTVAAPLLVRHRRNVYVQGFVRAVSAAAVGTILGASVVLARLAIGDWFTVGVASLSGFVLFRWQVPAPLLVGIAAAAVLIAFYALRPTWVLIR